MNKEFFEKLYRGYAAEHLVSGQLFKRGLEVFRLPADFGLDLVVTNQFQLAQNVKSRGEAFPFGLQVKSRWLKTKDIAVGNAGRPEVTFDYWLTPQELSVVEEMKNAGIAFVFYWPTPTGSNHVGRYFWLHSQHIRGLIDAGFLRLLMVRKRTLIEVQPGEKLRSEEVEARYKLTVRYSMEPHQKRDVFVAGLDKAFQLKPELKAILEKELPTEFVRNWNASAYLSFGRLPRNQSNSLVFKSPVFVPMDFESFPDCAPFNNPG